MAERGATDSHALSLPGGAAADEHSTPGTPGEPASGAAASARPVKLGRRTSVIYNQLEDLLKSITSADANNPLPVRDRYIRMRKYKQCFLG